MRAQIGRSRTFARGFRSERGCGDGANPRSIATSTIHTLRGVEPHFEADEMLELDEGSWAYLSLGDSDGDNRALSRRVIETCESNGWPAVSWSLPRHENGPADSARFFEGMSHAVEHADVVIVSVDEPSAMTDAELAFAYRYNKPVIALRIQREDPIVSGVQAMLRRYDRAFLVDCVDADGCVGGLREAFGDPRFAEIIGDAAGEPTTYA
jgi:nucleoside 2-deoxyribosyltransferase